MTIQPSRRRFLTSTATLVAGAAVSPLALAAKLPRKILIVATNVDQVAGHPSGTFITEIAYPFQIFRDQGFDVDVATPGGGRAAIYNAGKTSDEVRAIQQSPHFQQRTTATLSVKQIRAEDYAAVFVPGGHGQFFDVANNPELLGTIGRIHGNGGVVGASGHGIASLANVRVGSGYLVTGKKMTCFPGWAERAWMDVSDFGKALPFDMEVVLRERGADLIVCTKENRNDMQLILVADRRHKLVTGAFAMQAAPAARELLSMLQATVER